MNRLLRPEFFGSGRYAAEAQTLFAEFFADGMKLVLTALQTVGRNGPRGIAWLDLSRYL